MLEFLYETTPGRCLLKCLVHPEVSQLAGTFLDTRYSRFLIPMFVKRNDINLRECEKETIKEYSSFNECFCRCLKKGERPVREEKSVLISPCDGLLSAYRMEDNLVIPVKQSRYHISDLLRDGTLAAKYKDGFCLVFRLCVNHYHRYVYPDHGTKESNVFLPGILHTVRPIALRTLPVFVENSREYTVLHTENFGDVVQMEVGALLVGRICNQMHEGSFSKGEEKGCFQYGGSTIILLLEKDKVAIAPKLLRNTKLGRETQVRLGQGIGKQIQPVR